MSIPERRGPQASPGGGVAPHHGAGPGPGSGATGDAPGAPEPGPGSGSATAGIGSGPGAGPGPGSEGAAAEGARGRLAEQLAFLVEVDALKSVMRRNYLADASRRENTAEHSWTLALMALVLAEHADEPVDLPTVVQMVVLHDLVEVDAGDTSVYDEAGLLTKAAREQAAAERIFGLLPADQGAALRALWDEFEAGESPEARFAGALDRMAGFLLNHASGGLAWQEQQVTADRVLDRMAPVRAGSRVLADEAERRLAAAVADGRLAPGPGAAG